MSDLIGQAKLTTNLQPTCNQLATETISRQAALDAIKCAIWDKYTAKDAIDAVCNVPSADAVEVVRCKYCDLWNDWDSAGKDSLGNHVCSCAYWTREDGPVVYTADNDFCSNGERRRDEDESMD